MLVFNWNSIYRTAKGNPVEILRIFKMLAYKEIPKNRGDPIYKYHSKTFKGTSFVYNDTGLASIVWQQDPMNVAVYIALASRRSLGEYMTQGTLTLPLLHLPAAATRGRIEGNPLLYIKDDNLHFKLEELSLGEAKWR